ncbi:MAG: hypothetical protein FWG64_00775, partial [Firmicutes bacterium]|nr:hypothetical protein [Bacillota bacterium]
MFNNYKLEDKIFGGFFYGGIVGLFIGLIACASQSSRGSYTFILDLLGTLLLCAGIGAIVGIIVGCYLAWEEYWESKVTSYEKDGHYVPKDYDIVLLGCVIGVLGGFTICNGIWSTGGLSLGGFFSIGFFSLVIGGTVGAIAGLVIQNSLNAEAEQIAEANRKKQAETQRLTQQRAEEQRRKAQQKAEEQRQRQAEEQRKAQQRAEEQRQRQAEEQRKAQQKAKQQQWQRNQSAEINNIFNALKANPNYNVNFNFNRINQLFNEKQTTEQKEFIHQKLLERKTELNEITIDRILQRDFQNAKIGLTILSEF